MSKTLRIGLLVPVNPPFHNLVHLLDPIFGSLDFEPFFMRLTTSIALLDDTLVCKLEMNQAFYTMRVRHFPYDIGIRT
jgi:hypothetical protein